MVRKIITMLACVALSGKSVAQSKPCRSYSVGETIEREIPLKLVNHKTREASLSAFDKKLLILDFWATWCGACVGNFEKLHQLQEQFKSDLQILLVNSRHNGDDEAKIMQCLEKWARAKQRPFLLPSAVADEQLTAMFPTRGIPHYVWISSNGVVRAITGLEEITEQNIRRILSSDTAALPLKIDVNPYKPLFAAEQLPAGQLRRYSIFLKGFISGGGSGSVGFWEGKETFLRRSFRNVPIPEMYTIVSRQIDPTLVRPRIRFEVQDSSKLFYTGPPKDEFRWQKDNLYTFDFITSLDDSAQFLVHLLAELNRHSGYNGRFETRKIKCLALIRTSRSDKMKARVKGASSRQNFGYLKIDDMPVSILVKLLNQPLAGKNPAPLLIVDETGYEGNISVEVSCPFSDLPSLRKNLQRYDLDLQEVERDVRLFVVSARCPPQE